MSLNSKASCHTSDQCQYTSVVDLADEETLVQTLNQQVLPLKVRRLRHPPNPFPRASEILQVLKSINISQKIITYWGLSSNGVGQDRVPMIYSGNFDMDKGHVTSTAEIDLLIRFEPCLRSGGTRIFINPQGILKIGVREFTGDIDEQSKIPIKDLYAYQSCNGGGAERLSKLESQIFHQQISQVLNEAYARYC